MWRALKLVGSVSVAQTLHHQIVRLFFRSDGRYRQDTKSTDSSFGFSFTDGGRYEIDGQAITNIAPDEIRTTP